MCGTYRLGLSSWRLSVASFALVLLLSPRVFIEAKIERISQLFLHRPNLPIPIEEAKKRFVPYKYLSDDDKDRVHRLGFNENSWNNPYVSEDGPAIEFEDYDTIRKDFPDLVDLIGDLGITARAWDCYVTHYYNYNWNDFPRFLGEERGRQIQRGLEILGYDKFKWDTDSSVQGIANSFWDSQLTEAQRVAAAESMCYFNDLWNEESLEVYRMAIDGRALELPTYRYTPWDQLTNLTRVVASSLGYSELTWNFPSGPGPTDECADIEYTAYYDVFEDQRGEPTKIGLELEFLGFDVYNWENCVHRWEAFHWSELEEWGILPYLTAIGWNSSGWFAPVYPEIYNRTWAELTKSEKSTLGVLCYDQPRWDRIRLDSNVPTLPPTTPPTFGPTNRPTPYPTKAPTFEPSESPSTMPSLMPSRSPTRMPSESPSKLPSSSPSHGPTSEPSETPSKSPTQTPSETPTRLPSSSPTNYPTRTPSSEPSSSPTVSMMPSTKPSTVPSARPSARPSLSPSESPSREPSVRPTVSSQPSYKPSSQPSDFPSSFPTETPEDMVAFTRRITQLCDSSGIPMVTPTAVTDTIVRAMMGLYGDSPTRRTRLLQSIDEPGFTYFSNSAEKVEQTYQNGTLKTVYDHFIRFIPLKDTEFLPADAVYRLPFESEDFVNGYLTLLRQSDPVFAFTNTSSFLITVERIVPSDESSRESPETTEDDGGGGISGGIIGFLIVLVLVLVLSVAGAAFYILRGRTTKEDPNGVSRSFYSTRRLAATQSDGTISNTSALDEEVPGLSSEKEVATDVFPVLSAFAESSFSSPAFQDTGDNQGIEVPFTEHSLHRDPPSTRDMPYPTRDHGVNWDDAPMNRPRRHASRRSSKISTPQTLIRESDSQEIEVTASVMPHESREEGALGYQSRRQRRYRSSANHAARFDKPTRVHEAVQDQVEVEWTSPSVSPTEDKGQRRSRRPKKKVSVNHSSTDEDFPELSLFAQQEMTIPEEIRVSVPSHVSLGLLLTDDDLKVHRIFAQSMLRGRVQVGDRLVAVNDRPLIGWTATEFATLWKNLPPKEYVLMFRRGGS